MGKQPTKQLGELELAVMNTLWQASEPLNVNEVLAALGGTRAYTTVMTTLSRLHRKGYVKQYQNGRSYSYGPRMSRATVLRNAWKRFADVLAGGDVYALIPHLLGSDRPLSNAEMKRLRELAKSIRDSDDTQSDT